MSELISVLTIKEVTVIGLLIFACAYLVKANTNSLEKIDEERKRTEQKHSEEMHRILEECKEMKDERKQERKEWLGALEGNTKELSNIAQKLEVIPNIKSDIEGIKEKVNYIEKEMDLRRYNDSKN